MPLMMLLWPYSFNGNNPCHRHQNWLITLRHLWFICCKVFNINFVKKDFIRRGLSTLSDPIYT